MRPKMLRAKIHHAEVTRCDSDDVGSIMIDTDPLAARGDRPGAPLVLASTLPGLAAPSAS